jgi:hypothetical protein
VSADSFLPQAVKPPKPIHRISAPIKDWYFIVCLFNTNKKVPGTTALPLFPALPVRRNSVSAPRYPLTFVKLTKGIASYLRTLASTDYSAAATRRIRQSAPALEP